MGYVNTLAKNFGKLHSNVLVDQLKLCCCSFSGPHLLKLDSTGFY